MLRYQTRRHRYLMQESEQALNDAAVDGAPRQKRIAQHVLSDPKVLGLWESRHAELLVPVAEHRQRAHQIYSMRDIEVKLLHRRALIRTIRNLRLGHTARSRLLATFYARREALQRSNLCPCNACQHIGDLDLKIVVHRGPVLRYHLGGFHELSGLPVIAVHRLLKSNLHLARYLMITQAAGEACRLPAGFEPRAHVESYDGIGEMASRVYSFDPAALPQTATPAARRSLASRGRDVAHKLAANARMLWRAMRR